MPRQICGLKKGEFVQEKKNPSHRYKRLKPSSEISKSKWEEGEKKQFSKPGVMDLYNTYMVGVDVSADQQTIAYVRLMKGSVWYYSVFLYDWFMYEQSFVLVMHLCI